MLSRALRLVVGVLLAVSPTFAKDLPPIGIEEGQMYPDFLLPTVDNKLGRLSDYRGKKVLLFHFASW